MHRYRLLFRIDGCQRFSARYRALLTFEEQEPAVVVPPSRLTAADVGVRHAGRAALTTVRLCRLFWMITIDSVSMPRVAMPPRAATFCGNCCCRRGGRTRGRQAGAFKFKVSRQTGNADIDRTLNVRKPL
jgi:hypothetical protein